MEDSGQQCRHLPATAYDAVDIWHCDAHGYYSGIEGNHPGPDSDAALIEEAAELRFLRGIQLTDDAGLAEFQMIYPGWYMGQLFFDDAISEQVFLLEPYAGRTINARPMTRTTSWAIMRTNPASCSISFRCPTTG